MRFLRRIFATFQLGMLRECWRQGSVVASNRDLIPRPTVAFRLLPLWSTTPVIASNAGGFLLRSLFS
jgi:hypothetical protein